MTEPVWLTLQDVIAAHGEGLADHGGSDGVRDLGLLESALARPCHHFAYGQKSTFHPAAAYAHGIVRNHPFLDGNKRVGFLACCLFLDLNGYEMNASEEAVVETWLALAEGAIDEEFLAQWIENSCIAK